MAWDGRASFRRMLPMLAGILVAAALMSVALLTFEDHAGDLMKPESRATFPDFTLVDLEGRDWTLSAQRGDVVVANFWATTCGPCLAEMPRLLRIAKRFENEGVRMIGISTDENPQDVVPAVARQYHISYRILAYNPTPILTVKGRSHFPIVIDSVPRTLLFDRAGRMACDYRGVVNEGVLASDITHLLREPANRQQR